MKFVSTILATSVAAFAPSKVAQSRTSLSASLEGLTGALAPAGAFDPLGLAAKATDATLARYREAELAHADVFICLPPFDSLSERRLREVASSLMLRFPDLPLPTSLRFLMDSGL